MVESIGRVRNQLGDEEDFIDDFEMNELVGQKIGDAYDEFMGMEDYTKPRKKVVEEIKEDEKLVEPEELKIEDVIMKKQVDLNITNRVTIETKSTAVSKNDEEEKKEIVQPVIKKEAEES